MDVVVAHHGFCFDGACSAAVFTRFLRDRDPALARASYEYRGLHYDPNSPPPGERLKAGALNAILDYRYSTSNLLAWYFDHHVSAFQEPGSEAHFKSDATGQKFHDGAYGSCTKLIVDVARERFGWAPEGLDELVRWADIIDAARFASADEANSFAPAAMRISAVIQEQGDDRLLATLIPALATRTLDEVAAMPEVASRVEPIKARYESLAKRMESVGEQRGAVAWFDLSEQPLDTVAKFIGYQLYPTASYSVVLSRSPRRVKLSVGFNPWATKPRKHDIAALCQRYGGGGHPVVGAVSLPASDLERAKVIADEMIRALNA